MRTVRPAPRPPALAFPLRLRARGSVVALLAILALPVALASADTASFRTDILPVLTKAGCNAGACHGAATGQGGFRLSLLGYDPDEDFLRLTREDRGRRVDLAAPADSLLLRKASLQLDHEGGRRLARQSEDYALLLRWIAEGAPRGDATLHVVSIAVSPTELRATAAPDTPSLAVEATLSDGTRRDVTRHALYDSNDEAIAEVSKQGRVTLRGKGLTSIMVRYGGQVAAARVVVPYAFRPLPAPPPSDPTIDRHVGDQWARLGLDASPEADDATFLRRVTLDLAGRLPTVDEARRAHREAAAEEQRLARIDALLRSEDFVDYWTFWLSEILLVGGKEDGARAITGYHDWLQKQVAVNRALDTMVRDLLTARGDATDGGPTLFLGLARDPRDLAEHVGRMFLGTRIACARCHSHPGDRWTQEDYHAFAAYFARVGFDGTRVQVRSRGEVDHPKTGLPVPPKPLGAPRPEFDSSRVSEGEDARRVELAEWLVAPENPFFARAWVNRVWRHFFGRGLVEPVDDMRPTNPATHPELLDALAREFAEHAFDLRWLIRTVVSSRTYRLACLPTGNNASDQRLLARFYPRELPAPVFVDAVAAVTGVASRFGADSESDPRAVRLADPRTPSASLDVLGRCARARPCNGPSRTGGGLAKALHLIHGELIHDRLKGGVIDALLTDGSTDPVIVDELYFRAYARPPRADELEQATRWLRDAPDRRQAVEDLLWALLNSREFGFNH